MVLRASMVGLLLLSACDNWDRQGVPNSAPSVQSARSSLIETCKRIERGQVRNDASEATFYMLLDHSGENCDEAIASILALKELDLSDFPDFPQGLDLAMIAEIQGLESLDLSNHRIASVKPLATLKNLKYLNVSDTGVNQKPDQLDLTSLNFENLKRLRLTVKEERPQDKKARLNLWPQFKKYLNEGETLVVAYIDRGVQFVPLPLPPTTEPKKRAEQIAEYKSGAKTIPNIRTLGTFVDNKFSEAHPEPTLVVSRGYLLDISVVSAPRDSDAAIKHLKDEWSEDLLHNAWTKTGDANVENYLRVSIGPADRKETAQGRPGAVPLHALQQGSTP